VRIRNLIPTLQTVSAVNLVILGLLLAIMLMSPENEYLLTVALGFGVVEIIILGVIWGINHGK
jgi:purine-cytosine permease-like protein